MTEGFVRTFSLHKVRENCQFLDHPPTLMSLHNIKIAPYLKPQVIFFSSLTTFFADPNFSYLGFVHNDTNIVAATN